LDVLDARLVGTQEPDCVDLRVGDHRRDRPVGPARADVESAPEGGRGLGALAVRAPDADDIAVAHADPRPHVKSRDEAAANEADTETPLLHAPAFYWRRVTANASLARFRLRALGWHVQRDRLQDWLRAFRHRGAVRDHRALTVSLGLP